MCNDYLKQTTDERLNDRGVDDALRANIQYYRSETRFLRALIYYHAMDMFGNTPFITENDPIGTYLPPQRSRAELYSFIDFWNYQAFRILGNQDRMSMGVPTRQLSGCCYHAYI